MPTRLNDPRTRLIGPGAYERAFNAKFDTMDPDDIQPNEKYEADILEAKAADFAAVLGFSVLAVAARSKPRAPQGPFDYPPAMAYLRDTGGLTLDVQIRIDVALDWGGGYSARRYMIGKTHRDGNIPSWTTQGMIVVGHVRVDGAFTLGAYAADVAAVLDDIYPGAFDVKPAEPDTTLRGWCNVMLAIVPHTPENDRAS